MGTVELWSLGGELFPRRVWICSEWICKGPPLRCWHKGTVWSHRPSHSLPHPTFSASSLGEDVEIHNCFQGRSQPAAVRRGQKGQGALWAQGKLSLSHQAWNSFQDSLHHYSSLSIKPDATDFCESSIWPWLFLLFLCIASGCHLVYELERVQARSGCKFSEERVLLQECTLHLQYIGAAASISPLTVRHSRAILASFHPQMTTSLPPNEGSLWIHENTLKLLVPHPAHSPNAVRKPSYHTPIYCHSLVSPNANNEAVWYIHPL